MSDIYGEAFSFVNGYLSRSDKCRDLSTSACFTPFSPICALFLSPSYTPSLLSLSVCVCVLGEHVCVCVSTNIRRLSYTALVAAFRSLAVLGAASEKSRGNDLTASPGAAAICARPPPPVSRVIRLSQLSGEEVVGGRGIGECLELLARRGMLRGNLLGHWSLLWAGCDFVLSAGELFIRRATFFCIVIEG